MLMLPSPTWWAVPEIFPLNAPGWSLFVEMLLSILFFRAVHFRTKNLWTMLAGAFVALILLRLFLGYLGGGFSWRDGPSGLVRGVYGFSAGLLIARLPERSPIRTQWAWLPIVVTGALLAINPPHGAAYDILLIVLALPAITLASVRLEPVAVLPFRTLGDLSYAIYALHSATFFTLQQLGDWHPERPGTPLTGLTALALFLVGCWIIDRYYDCPVRTYLTRKSQGPAFGRRVNG
jgi:peptidoglycan/LPS O-acetylase OafA/YrhL